MNLPATRYFPLSQLNDTSKRQLEVAKSDITESLSAGHLSSIVNAFWNNTLVCENGMIFIRISGLSTILRTGGSGAERPLIYSGVRGILPPAEILEFEGREYISGPQLLSLLEYRRYGKRGVSAQYLRYAFDVYTAITRSGSVRDIQDVFLDRVSRDRHLLKKARVEQFEVTNCELSGIRFESIDKVEFSHIDSVSAFPQRALDISNGLIVMKDIHRDITTRGIQDYEGMYAYCLEKGYSLRWASV